MRRGILAGVFILIFFVMAIASTPLAFVVGRIEGGQPALPQLGASGSVWNGQVLGLRFRQQNIGNISLTSGWAAPLSGKWKSSVQLTDGAVSGRGDLSVGLNGSVWLNNVRISGATDELTGLRPEIRSLDGHFMLDILSANLKNNACRSATGTARTDILTKLEERWRWEGPELSGPVSCESGKFVVRLSGKGKENELISALMNIGLDSSGAFEVRIENPPEEVAQAASLLGFVYDGINAITYRFELNSGEPGSRDE
jgi:hypothetical protein